MYFCFGLYKEKQFVLNGSDFENDLNKLSQDVLQKTKPNIVQKINVFNRKHNSIKINNIDLTNNLDKKIDEIALQIDCEPSGGDVLLNENGDFTVSETIDGCIVNKQLLKEQIHHNLKNNSNIEIEIPIVPKVSPISKQELEEQLQKRSEFSTNYSSSVDGRKHNVQLALSAFNGFKVEVGQEVSFNDIVNSKISSDEFKTAKVILNGEFVDGKGGGICQASTTLYNALLLADIEILEVHPHSLPVAYVPLAFDAMVNQGSADLKFKNNLESPIYFKTWGDETNAYVEIWGPAFEEGRSVRRRADFVGTLPHPGDKIVPDTEGKYSDKITFKGEYYRVKMPQEGYESKAVIEYLQDGKVVDEKLIRHEYYGAQYGVIYEGTEDLIDGIELPENDVKFIPPQQQNHSNQEIADNKIEKQNPTEYNP